MLHVLVCSESQRAVRAERPERHRRPRRRRSTRFEARQRPGGPQAAEAAAADGSKTQRRSRREKIWCRAGARWTPFGNRRKISVFIPAQNSWSRNRAYLLRFRLTISGRSEGGKNQLPSLDSPTCMIPGTSEKRHAPSPTLASARHVPATRRAPPTRPIVPEYE